MRADWHLQDDQIEQLQLATKAQNLSNERHFVALYCRHATAVSMSPTPGANPQEWKQTEPEQIQTRLREQ